MNQKHSITSSIGALFSVCVSHVMASYPCADDEDAPWLENKNRTIFITRQIRYFVDDYIKEESLGEPGTFGTAYKCYKKADISRSKPFAVKEINKARFNLAHPTEKEELLSTMQNEIAILLKVRHKNIVELYDVYESRDQLHLVMEYLPGGELFDRICDHPDGYGEKQAANIIKQILNALNKVHSKQILHLDLKPENVLFKDNTDDSVKLIDFGMARIVPKLTVLEGKVGTIQYMAPEVISGGLFSYGADVWSVGVMLYCMLFGYPPFNDYDSEVVTSEKHIETQILNGFDPVVMDGYGAWFPKSMPISKECMKLITHMLEKDVAKRWTVKECLSCKWIQQKEYKQSFSPLFKESLLKYRKKNKFRTAISNLFTHYLDVDVKQEIAQHFNDMDTNHDGVLSLKEFECGLKKLNSDISSEQIETIFKNLDFNNDYSLSLNELIMSTNMTSLVSRDVRLYDAFEKLDSNHDGSISRTEMEKAVKSIGLDDDNKEENGLTLRRLQSAFDEADRNHDGTIDYDEFLSALHPTLDKNESCSSILKANEQRAERSLSAASFNVSNKMAKGTVLQPKAYSANNIVNDADDHEMETLRKENERLKLRLKLKSDELSTAKGIYSKNIAKVLKLQNEITTKDKKIKLLAQTVNQLNDELNLLRGQ
eukprot:801631_1